MDDFAALYPFGTLEIDFEQTCVCLVFRPITKLHHAQ